MPISEPGKDPGTRLDRLSVDVDNWLSAHFHAFLAIASILCGLTFVGYSHAKLPWTDEILQTLIARLPGAREIWAALMESIQIDPPVVHLLQHYLIAVFGEHILVMRMPAIVGFCVMCVCMALLVRRHVPATYAAAAFFLPYATALRGRSMDARPYGLLLGFSALTIFVWDSIDATEKGKNLRRLGLALCVAATLSMHFYGILILLPLATGELMKWVLRKKIDWLTGLAVLVGIIPFFFWFPVLRAATVSYAKTHHYKVAFANLNDFYGYLIASLPMAGFLLALLVAAMFAGRFRTAPVEAPLLSERYRLLLAVSAGFMLIPPAAYLGGILTTGLFIPYHLLVSGLGVIIGLPLVIPAATNRSRLVGLCLLTAILGQGAMVTARGLSGYMRREKLYPTLEEIRRLIPAQSPDVVVASPLNFLPFYEFTRSDPGNNLLYLYDAPKALIEQQTDIADLMLPKLGARTGARVLPLDPYLAQHRRFYIAVMGETLGVQEWQFSYLMKKAHASLLWLGKAGNFDIYQVDLPSSGQTASTP